MDGATLLYRLRQLLDEAEGGEYFEDRVSYDFLYQAAMELVSRTQCLRGQTTITIVADQTNYDLPADFMHPALKRPNNAPFIKYNDGSTNHFITHRDYEDMVYGDNSTSVTIPDYFSIVDELTNASRIAGTASGDGAATNGESTLTTSSSLTEVSVGDIVHNTTDGSSGVVIAKPTASTLTTCLFDGTSDDWTSGDGFVIMPQGRLQLVFDPPPSTAGHTVTVEYIRRPTPVYSSYAAYPFRSQHQDALIYYAAWLYKYKDRDPNFGDVFYRTYENQLRKAATGIRKSRNMKRLNVCLRA